VVEPQETSGVTTALLLRYVRGQAGDEAVADVIRRSGVAMAVDELEDHSHWVGYDTRIRLFAAATEVLGDPGTMREVGANALHNGLNHSLVLLLRALGSPQHAIRMLPRAVPKFSTTSTMDVLEAGATRATIRFRLHEGYEPSALDCMYAQGLITAMPEVFGLPAARIVHDECQAEGDAACIYHLDWGRYRRLPWPRRVAGTAASEDAELVALRGQLRELQQAAAELVGSEDLAVVLERITRRAASAVLAPAYLLAVTAADGSPLVRSAGLEPARAEELATTLLAGGDLGPAAVVVDVASSRRHHGFLAALYREGQQGMVAERSLLGAYAGYAAATLDMLTALEHSRRGESRARGLLDLAHGLAGAPDADAITDIVADAIPGIVGSQTATVMLWDPAVGELRFASVAGWPEAQRSCLLGTRLRPDDTAELMEMLARREGVHLTRGDVSAPLGRLLDELGLGHAFAVPLLAGDTLVGAISASWGVDGSPEGDSDVLPRMQGVADQAAIALWKAQLHSTVRHQSLHDALTGLPNRVLFTERLEQSLRAATNDAGVAVLFCDLDRFKNVNDELGHAAGDELLRQVAARLRSCLRPVDTVGRLSGDEFAFLLPQVREPATATTLAERVISCFQEPFRIEGRELRVTTSVGVAVQTGPDGRASRLLRAADSAMYVAKQGGRNQIATSDAIVPRTPSTAPSLEVELATAAERGELRLHFQPMVEIAAAGTAGDPIGQVVGAEALIRWQHPRLGLLAPAAFLTLAEETGLAVELDLWTLETACAALAGAAPQPGGLGREMHVAVNLAAASLLDSRLLPAVRSALVRHGLTPWQLHLEIVESRSLIDLPGVIDRLAELRQLGIRISLDDFGTGYSTLTWLQRLPVDQVKIDRTFVTPLPDDATSLAVVRGVLALANELGLDVVAEGVEDAAQLQGLRAAGCGVMQGYLLGRPIPEPPWHRAAVPVLAAGEPRR
jgi:diguanylate cyclase (GGDEF)-like protein